MNDTRRRRITSAYNKIEAAKEILQSCLDAEETYNEGMSQKLRDGDEGPESDDAIDTLTDLINHIDALDFAYLREDS